MTRATGAAAAATALAEATQSLIVVADQEGDTNSHFARQPTVSNPLVRARHDRTLYQWPKMLTHQTIDPSRIFDIKPKV